MSGSSGRQRRPPPAIVRQNFSKSPTHRAARTPCVRLSGRKRVPVPTRGLKPDVSRFRRDLRGRKKKQDKGMASHAAALTTSARSAGSFGRLKLASLRDEKSADGVSFPKSPVLQGFSRMSYSKKEELNEKKPESVLHSGCKPETRRRIEQWQAPPTTARAK